MKQGIRIGEYILDERVGVGASGEVWSARHHVWADRLVAIKIPTTLQSIIDLQRQEIVVKDLSHPGIVRMLGFDPYSEPSYIVMELVAGTSLRPWIERGSLSPTDAVTVITRLLEALSYAHARGIVHGDVKPENILIDDRARVWGLGATGMIKLTDFGLGKKPQGSSESIALSTSLTSVSSRTVGTLDYLSPEQKQGAAIDARTDVYACGVVLYEMLTGSKPAGMEAPTELNPKVPAYLDEVFRKAYARLEKRYESAADFLVGIEQGAKAQAEMSLVKTTAPSKAAQVQYSPRKMHRISRPASLAKAQDRAIARVDCEPVGSSQEEHITGDLADRLLRGASVTPVRRDLVRTPQPDENLLALQRAVLDRERAVKPRKTVKAPATLNSDLQGGAVLCGAICAFLVLVSVVVAANGENPMIAIVIAFGAFKLFMYCVRNFSGGDDGRFQ